MNRRTLTALLLTTLPLHVAAAAEPIIWQGNALTVVNSRSDLPPHIRAGFDMDAPAPAGVADIGGFFNSGDVTIAGHPNRGLVGAGHIGDTWVLAIAQGRWNGTAVIAYVFEGPTLTRQERVGIFWGSAAAFASIVRALNQPPRPPAQLGGVSISDSKQQIRAKLGDPAGLVDHEQTYIGDPANKPTDLRITQELRYAGLSVWLRDDTGILDITATGEGHCQTGRICIGATRTVVESELAALGSGGFAPNTNSYSLRHESRGCQADLSFTSGIVSTIRVWCPL